MFTEETGMTAEGFALRRLRLPARLHGAGLRSRVVLAPAAFCASLVTAAEAFLPHATVWCMWDVGR